MQSKLLMVAALAVAAWSMPAAATTHKEAPDMKACVAKAAEQNLKGAAKNSFMKKCEKDAMGGASMNAGCEKKAADQNLKGAAKTSFVKKCSAEAAPAAKS